MTYIYRPKIRAFKRACLVCTALVSLAAAPAHAQNSALKRSDLMGLAKEFVTRIGNGFEQADQRPAQILKPGANVSSRIPNGEELILQMQAGPQKIPLNYDIIAIKQSYGMDVMLEDFFAAVDFPIFINDDAGTAEGWFIRENQTFQLDVPSQRVVIQGQEIPLLDGEVFEMDGEYYAQSTALEKWFNMRFAYNFEELRVTVYSAQPLPAEERFARENREAGSSTVFNDPILPFEELEYSAFDVPFFDVNLQGSYVKREDTEALKRARYSIIGAGDFAYLNANTFLSGDDDDLVTTFRAKFDRESLEPDLLGPLKARYFSFGDIDSTDLEIASRSIQEQGVRVTNRLDTRSTGYDTTYFRGNAQPGWDAELYRDDRLVATQQIGIDGQYEFLEVPLFAGSNDFRIVLYGPQGEIREITESIPVNADSLLGKETYYDVSLTRNGEITYEANDIDRPQDGTPTLTARVDHGLTENMSGFAGFLSRDEGDIRRNYIESGISTYANETFLDLNTSYEASESEFGASATARRNFGAHSARGTVFAATDGFQPAPDNQTNPTTFRTNAQLNGPAKNFFGLSSSYGINANYQKFAQGNHFANASANYSTRLSKAVVNNGLSFTDREDINGTQETTLEYNTNVRGFFKGGFYRLASNYEVLPDMELDTLFASYNYPFTQNLDGLVEVEHNLNPSLTELRGSLNWKTDKATISPRFTYDTENTLEAFLNVRFGLAYNPATNDLDMFNQRISTTGGVSARVFLDKNGNGIFDGNDQLLENATLKAVQANREALSDKNGVAFIPDLPQGLITDVMIERESLEDPYYIPNYEGVSIRPRPGVVKELDFPIVVAGEMDGTVELRDEDGSKSLARQFKMNLIAPWGEVIQSTATAYDGFYVFIDVPPGIYYLLPDYETAKRAGYQMPSPRRYIFKPDGSIFYDQNFVLNEGTPIDYSFESDIEPKSRKNKQVLQSLGPTSASLRIGPFTSRLAATVAMLKVKRAQSYIRQGLSIQDPLESLSRDADTKKYWINAESGSGSVADAETACRALAGFEIPCQVKIFTRAYQGETTALNTVIAPQKSG